MVCRSRSRNSGWSSAMNSIRSPGCSTLTSTLPSTIDSAGLNAAYLRHATKEGCVALRQGLQESLRGVHPRP
eukprot:801442-Prymnesium_polylepis.1